jgi:polyhydroxybutyrate depolymerase
MLTRRLFVPLPRREAGNGAFLYLLFAVTLITSLSACGQATKEPTNTPAPTIQVGNSEHTLTIGGMERTYQLHIPPGMNQNDPAPLVFVFHGYDPETFYAITGIQNLSGFNDTADKNGFLTVYPYGISGSWNAGKCCGAAVQNNVDDIGFVRQILQELGKSYNIDSKRIFATGLASGAMFSYRLACEVSDTFAAIAPLAGVLLIDPCQPTQPVSILQIHGLKDNAVPYAGGVGGLATGKIEFPSVEKGITTWLELDGCGSSPTVEKKDLLTHTIYSSCRAGTAVELYTHDALGSSWPSIYVFPAAQMIWDFFNAHPKL